MPVIPTYDSQIQARPAQAVAPVSKLLSITDTLGPEIQQMNDKFVQLDRDTVSQQSALDYTQQLEGIRQDGVAKGVRPADMADYLKQQGEPLIKNYTDQFINPDTKMQIQASLNKQLIAHQADSIDQSLKLVADQKRSTMLEQYNSVQRQALQSSPAMAAQLRQTADESLDAQVKAGLLASSDANKIKGQSEVDAALYVAMKNPELGIKMAQNFKYADPQQMVQVAKAIRSDQKQAAALAEQTNFIKRSVVENTILADPEKFNADTLQKYLFDQGLPPKDVGRLAARWDGEMRSRGGTPEQQETLLSAIKDRSFDSSNKDFVNSFNFMVRNLPTDTPPEAVGGLISGANYAPPALLDSLSSRIMSGTPEQQVQAAKVISSVPEQQASLFAKMDSVARPKAQAITSMVAMGIPEQQAVQKANATFDNIATPAPEMMKVITSDARKFATSQNNSELSGVRNQATGFLSPKFTPGVQNIISNELETAYKSYRIAGSNDSDAKKLATQDAASLVGISKVGSSHSEMLLPPDVQPGVQPERTKVAIQKLVGDNRYTLSTDPITIAAHRNGQPLTWPVFVEDKNTGAIVKMPYRVDANGNKQ